MRFRPVVIAPTFNNAGTLPDVLNELAAVGVPVIVVDDGCTDSTPQILADRMTRRQLVDAPRHDRNRGKAAALRTGFACAAQHGYTHAVTIDTDGQLDPQQVPMMVAAAQQSPYALVLGMRDEHQKDYPRRSRVGRRASNCMVRIESGAKVSDSQCGMRVYPLDLIQSVHCRAQRYGYETEIITRAAWAGCPIVQVGVKCRYLPPGQQVSHFRVVHDTLRGIAMHMRLVTRALLPWPHPKWPAAPERISTVESWRQLVRDLSPRKTWQSLVQDEQGRSLFAVGLSVGVLIANLPFYGFQTVLSVYAAKRLHLHPAAVVLGSQASTPPIGIALGVIATYIGSILLYGQPPVLPETGASVPGLAAAPWLLLAWLVGSVIVGFVLGAITLGVTLVLFRWVLPSRQAAQAGPVSVEAET